MKAYMLELRAMDPGNQDSIREILRLTRDTNQMLHSMRRNAFIAGFLKFIIYAILFAAPIWFYMTYISGTVDNLLSAVDKLEGTSSAAQAKFTGFEDAIKKLEASLPSFMRPATTTDTATP